MTPELHTGLPTGRLAAPPAGFSPDAGLEYMATSQVGPALFSLITIVVSFLPVFLLEAQEGRMFRPLAWTKTLALVFSSLLSITLVPALMPLSIGGRLRPESLPGPPKRFTCR